MTGRQLDGREVLQGDNLRSACWNGDVNESLSARISFYLLIYNRRNMQEEEEDEELLEINIEVDMKPWSDEDYERVREMEKKGGLTEEEREECRRCCQ